MQMALQVPTSSTTALGLVVEKEEAAAPAPVSGVLKKTPDPLLYSSFVSVTSQAFDFSCCWSLWVGGNELWSDFWPREAALEGL